MPESVKASEDPKVAADVIEGEAHQRIKLQHGTDGSATDVSTASPLPVGDAGGALSVDDGGSSLTVDAPLGSPVAVRLSDGSEGIGATAKRLHVDDGGSSLSVDDNGGSLTVDVGTALPAGNNNIGDVDVASIAAGTNAIGNVGLIPRASGGLSMFRTLDLDETEEAVKEAAGQVYGYYFANRSAGERFIKFYNATPASVTVGTTTPVLTLPLPKESAGHVPIPQGLAFGTAITVAATTGLADNSTGAPGEGDVVLNVYYA